MSEARHTPGPWKADVEGPWTLGGDTIGVEAVTGDGRMVRREICTLAIDTEGGDDTPEALEDLANARLIAAAPDLLASARAILAWAKKHDRGHEGSELLEILCETAAAVRKATGEAP